LEWNVYTIGIDQIKINSNGQNDQHVRGRPDPEVLPVTNNPRKYYLRISIKDLNKELFHGE
jgi:hypothetical protein